MLKFLYMINLVMNSISPSWSNSFLIKNMTSHPVNLNPNFSPHQSTICRGGLQVDLRDESKLLVSICANPWRLRNGNIGTIPINNLEGPVSILTDDALNQPQDEQELKRPEFLHQSRNKNNIIFLESMSCVRQVDRSTKIMTTIIGKKCKENIFDVIGKGVHFMAFDQSTENVFLGAPGVGIYMYEKGDGSYDSRTFIPKDKNEDAYGMTFFNGYLWTSSYHNIRRIDIANLRNNNYDKNTGYSEEFLRFATFHSNRSRPSDKEKNSDLLLNKADFSLSPNKKIFMIADLHKNVLLFVDIASKIFNVLGAIDNDEDISILNSTSIFSDISAVVWLDDNKILVHDQQTSSFIKISLSNIPSSLETRTAKGMKNFAGLAAELAIAAVVCASIAAGIYFERKRKKRCNEQE